MIKRYCDQCRAEIPKGQSVYHLKLVYDCFFDMTKAGVTCCGNTVTEYLGHDLCETCFTHKRAMVGLPDRRKEDSCR